VLLASADITEAIQYEMGLQSMRKFSQRISLLQDTRKDSSDDASPWHFAEATCIQLQSVECLLVLVHWPHQMLIYWHPSRGQYWRIKGYQLNLRADDPPFRLDMRVANDQDKSDASLLHMLLHPGLNYFEMACSSYLARLDDLACMDADAGWHIFAVYWHSMRYDC